MHSNHSQKQIMQHFHLFINYFHIEDILFVNSNLIKYYCFSWLMIQSYFIIIYKITWLKLNASFWISLTFSELFFIRIFFCQNFYFFSSCFEIFSLFSQAFFLFEHHSDKETCLSVEFSHFLITIIVQLCFDFFFSFFHRFLILSESHTFSDLLNSHTTKRMHFFKKFSDISWKILQTINKTMISLLQSNFCSSSLFIENASKKLLKYIQCIYNNAARSTGSHLYAVTGTSNQPYIGWRNQDELRGKQKELKSQVIWLFAVLLILSTTQTRPNRVRITPTSLRFSTPESTQYQIDP